MRLLQICVLSVSFAFLPFANCAEVAAKAGAPNGPSGQTPSRRVEFVQEFHPQGQTSVELWIPTPNEAVSYQKLISREFSGNATSVQIAHDPIYGAEFVHARWQDVKDPVLKITNIVEIHNREGKTPEILTDDLYLQPTEHVQIDGIVRSTALKITKGLHDPDRQARAIYDWVVENTVRNPETRGCGLGDVKSLLASGHLSGKCVDINSLFVGLTRAVGIPSREIFGMRIAPSEISKAQHCRAEYYSQRQKAWIPVDPADVRKLILEDHLTLQDEVVKTARKRFFGAWEGTWVAFNWARDFQINGYDSKPVNFLMYPLLVAGENRPDGVDPQETGYIMRSRAL